MSQSSEAFRPSEGSVRGADRIKQMLGSLGIGALRNLNRGSLRNLAFLAGMTFANLSSAPLPPAQNVIQPLPNKQSVSGEIGGHPTIKPSFQNHLTRIDALSPLPPPKSTVKIEGAPGKIIPGKIPESERITFAGTFIGTGVGYEVHYLPPETHSFAGETYHLAPTSIIWHWDAQPNTARSVQTTYRGLLSNNLSAHFAVGPVGVGQMMYMGESTIQQGRLSNDKGINKIDDAASFGWINIETTGKYYDDVLPPAQQTENLIRLTIALMKQYGIPFSQVAGHFERAAGIGKSDPGPKYTNQVRQQLLLRLIGQRAWDLIGPLKTLNFYKEIRTSTGGIRRVTTQSADSILASLSASDREMLLENSGK